MAIKNLLFQLLVFLILTSPALVYAGPLANQKLLDFLKKNGALTEEQVREIKNTLDQEEKQETKQQEQKEAKDVKVSYDDGLHFRTNDKSFNDRIFNSDELIL